MECECCLEPGSSPDKSTNLEFTLGVEPMHNQCYMPSEVIGSICQVTAYFLVAMIINIKPDFYRTLPLKLDLFGGASACIKSIMKNASRARRVPKD